MNKRIKGFGLAVGFATVIASGTALAAAPWSNAVTISSIEVDPTATSSVTYLTFTSTPTGRPAACNTATQFEFTGPVDQIKSMTSLATAAFLSGKTVKIYYTGTCDGTYPLISLISIQ